MVPIGAAWGYRSREELEKAGAYEVYDTPTDLASMIEKSPII
jgi:phosphoglycolate phosphatase-like HAD superfamily hydrolase